MTVAAPASTRTLQVYGLSIEVAGGWPEVVDSVAKDFAWFASEGAAGSDGGERVIVEQRAPDFDSLGPLTAAFVTPRNVVYVDGERQVVDYFGKALCIVDRAAGTVTVQGQDAHLVHEAAYLYLLSRVGEHLDQRGLTRLHALALSGTQGGVAVMLPSGGGKSTLAVRALRDDRVTILSEDTPLLDRKGVLHPFPLRIGVNATDAETLPEAGVRRIERMEFHPKLVLDLEAFADRIESDPRPLRHIVVGRRSLGTEATLEQLPRRMAAGAMFREAVVGVGVYQGMEFVLQRGMRDVAGKAGIAASRAACCAAGLRGARVWRLTLGRDHDANWEALSAILR
jgi:hypothetical protein